MKKIIIGVFVLALLVSSAAHAERGSRYGQNDDTATSTRSELKDKLKNRNKNASSTVDATCVSAAVSERETAIMTAWTTFSGKITTILTDRKADLTTAWAMSDSKERKAAVKDAWANAKKDRKAAAQEYKSTKKTAWTEFKKDAKACGGSDGMDASGESEASEKVEI